MEPAELAAAPRQMTDRQLMEAVLEIAGTDHTRRDEAILRELVFRFEASIRAWPDVP